MMATYLRSSVWFPLLLFVLAFVCQPELAEAYSEEENLAFINKILDLLNNNQECNLPTYEEVDELQKSFTELESAFGQQNLAKRLNEDQKLVRETLLDQWDSFSKRMNSGVVIRSAKKRAFLCKVEQYQNAKFKSSVCSKTKQQNNSLIGENIFEKNPLVRYIKHLETNKVQETVESGDTVEIVRTPIGIEASNNESKIRVDKDDEDYDPLAGIPVPLAIEQTDLDCDCNVVCPLKSLNRTLDTTTTESELATTTTEAPTDFVSTTTEAFAFEVTPNTEILTTTEITGYNITEVPILIEVATESWNFNASVVVNTTETEPVNKKDCNCGCSGFSTLFHNVTTPMDYERLLANTTDEAAIEPEVIDRQFDELGRHLVDSAFDDEDLKRLNVIVPSGNLTFVSRNGLSSFKWPDEVKESDQVESLAEEASGASVKEEWCKFLEDPNGEANDSNEVDVATEQPIVEETTTTARPFNGMAHRRKRKEYLQSVMDDKARRESDAMFGWEEPKPTPPPKPENWALLMNGKAIKIAYNRDYLKNSAGVKAVKSLFSSSSKDKGGYKRKKRLMS